MLSGGAVPLLNLRDASRLVGAAAADDDVALTNNRYSSDVIAVARGGVLTELPPLPSDNALPRWLEERAGIRSASLARASALASISIRHRTSRSLRWLAQLPVGFARRRHQTDSRSRDWTRSASWPPTRIASCSCLAAAALATLRWLERNVRARVRFFAEERGLRASSPLAIGGRGRPIRRGCAARAPRLALLLDERGPGALAEIVSSLGDGAIIDSRVLLAHRLGGDESAGRRLTTVSRATCTGQIRSRTRGSRR